ncbi:hypothetical protein R1flu_005218 [Riccia fluitans]|uniref:Uncharacterized protein n=1 Tax=Riccia fluitans TaxID=41844 RepID=A0ABD1YSJ3_9MARC
MSGQGRLLVLPIFHPGPALREYRNSRQGSGNGPLQAAELADGHARANYREGAKCRKLERASAHQVDPTWIPLRVFNGRRVDEGTEAHISFLQAGFLALPSSKAESGSAMDRFLVPGRNFPGLLGKLHELQLVSGVIWQGMANSLWPPSCLSRNLTIAPPGLVDAAQNQLPIGSGNTIGDSLDSILLASVS